MSLDLREPRNVFLTRWYQLAAFAGFAFHFARSDRNTLYELQQVEAGVGGAPMPRGLSREQVLVLKRDYGRWNIAQIWRDMTDAYELTLAPPFVFSLRREVTAGRMAQARVPRLCNEFSRAGLVEKAAMVQAHVGIAVPLIDQLESLQRARQCLVQRAGVVHERDCVKGEDFLALHWTRQRPIGPEKAAAAGARGTRSFLLETMTKRFAVGNPITMGNDELSEAFVTFPVAVAEFYLQCKALWGDEVRIDDAG